MDQAGWDERYAGPELIWGAGPNRFVTEELGSLPPGRAIDLGTGEGRNAIWLADRGWRVTGVDFSAVGLARAARLASERGVRVDWVHADLVCYQPEPAGYDLVLIAYIQLPAERLVRIFSSAAEATAPGGTMLVVGHDLENIEHGYGGPQDAARLYTPELITASLGGLTIERAGRVKRPVQTPDGERVAIDTLVLASRAI